VSFAPFYGDIFSGVAGNMDNLKDYIRKSPKGFILKILVQPKSAKNQIVGLHGDELKIKLTAPPVDNAANRMCLQFLAKQLDIPKSAVEILTGHSSRHKQLLIKAANPDMRRLKTDI
jgi:hypothetical protein